MINIFKVRLDTKAGALWWQYYSEKGKMNTINLRDLVTIW